MTDLWHLHDPNRRVFNGMCINLLTRAEIAFRKIITYSVFLAPRANGFQEADHGQSANTQAAATPTTLAG